METLIEEDCLTKKLVYQAQMYRVERPYLAMKVNDTFTDTILNKCAQEYVAFEGHDNLARKQIKKVLTNLDVKLLFDIASWEFKKPEGCYKINGDYTYDMDLYFSIEDMRMLYDWKVKEFLKICELTSGGMADCYPKDFRNKDDYNICLEQKLSTLDSFNYITEDD